MTLKGLNWSKKSNYPTKTAKADNTAFSIEENLEKYWILGEI